VSPRPGPAARGSSPRKTAPSRISYLKPLLEDYTYAGVGGSRAVVVPDRNVLRKDLLSKADQAATAVPELLAQLRQVLAEADPLALYAQLHASDSVRRDALDGPANFGSDAMLEVFGALAASLPATEVQARIGVKFHPQLLFTAEALLRDLGNAQNVLLASHSVRPGTVDPSGAGLRAAQNLLRWERQFEGMSGYNQHVEQVCRAVFEPVAELSTRVLGFPPAIVFDLVDAYNKHLLEHVGTIVEQMPALQAHLSQGGWSRLDTAVHLHAFFCTHAAVQVAPLIKVIAEVNSTLPEEQVTQAILSLSTALGSHPDPATSSDNRLRLFPILAVGDGRYLWPRPIDLAHVALDWFAEACAAHPTLLGKFNTARQKAAERITVAAFSRVFGSLRTHANPTYADPARVETDAVVLLPGLSVVGEVKGLKFTTAGREGRPDRVEKKAGELVEHPLQQTARAVQALRNQADSWKTSSGKRLDVGQADTVLRVITSLERVDPFTTLIGRLAKAPAAGQPTSLDVWPVALTDLLAVVDILQTPHELAAYLQARTNITNRGNPSVMQEMDALASWCSNRTGAELTGNHPWTLAHQCEEINRYFTRTFDDEELPRPCSGLPDLAHQALDRQLSEHPDTWWACCQALMAATPKEWRPLQRLLAALPAREDLPRGTRQQLRRLATGYSVGHRFVVRIDHESLPTSAEEAGPRASLPLLTLALSTDLVVTDATWTLRTQPSPVRSN